MSSLTKEQLRNELISHGVEPPQPSSKKEELLKLYNKHVLPAQNAAGEFSSDEEFIDHPNGAADENGAEDPALAGLSDREVRDKLLAYGVEVGPVVASTRRFLVKKLSVLVKSSAAAAAVTGDSNGHTVDATDHAGAAAAGASGRPAAAAANGGGGAAAAGGDEARDRFSCDSSEDEQEQELAASEAVAEAVEAEVQSQHHRQQQLQLQRQQQRAEVRRRAAAAATATTTAATAAAAAVIDKGGVSCHSPAPGGESVRAVYLRSSRDTPSPRRSLQDARGSFSASSSSTTYSSQFASSTGHQRSFFKSLLGSGVASASAAGGGGVSGYRSTLSSREHGRYPYTAGDKSSSSSTRGAGRIVSMTLFAVKLLLLLTAAAAAIFFGYHYLVLGESMTKTFQSVEQTAYDALEQYRGRVAGSVPAADTDTNTAGHQ